MDIQAKLNPLGLPEREAQVLRFLLYYGETSPSSIAQKLGLNRTTIYDILNSLNKKGLIIKRLKPNNKLSFEAAPPKHWSSYWTQKESHLQEQKKALKNLMPDLEMLYKKSASQPQIIFYEDIDGVRRAALDSLETISGEIVGYSAVSQVVKHLTPKFIAYYTNQKIKRKIKSRFVLRSQQETPDLIKKYIEKYYKNDKTGQYAPRYRAYTSGKYTMKNEIMIYDDKLAILNITPPYFGAMIIQNKDIAGGQRAIFEIAWQASKPIK